MEKVKRLLFIAALFGAGCIGSRLQTMSVNLLWWEV